MSRAFVMSWYSRIPPAERTLPIIMYNGKVYTPEEVYREVMAGTRLGEALQAKIERLRASHSYALDDLKELDYIAKKRVEQVIKNLPPDFSLVAIGANGKRIYRPEELLKTRFFEKAVEREKKKVVKLLRG